MLMMHPYLAVTPDFKHPGLRKLGDVEIEIQTKYNWNKREANVNSGWVAVLPNRDEIFGNPVNINIGDYIYFHFHEVDDESKIIDGHHKVNFKTVYCKENEFGDIEMCNDYILLEPEWIIEEIDEEHLKQLSVFGPIPKVRRMVEDHGIVKYKPENLNLKIGVRTHLKPNSHYELRLKSGKTYLRVRERDIVLVEEVN